MSGTARSLSRARGVSTSRSARTSARSAVSSARMAAVDEASGAGDADDTAGTSSSSDLGGGTRMLARMLARAPMIPTPANITDTPVRRPRVVTGRSPRTRPS